MPQPSTFNPQGLDVGDVVAPIFSEFTEWHRDLRGREYAITRLDNRSGAPIFEDQDGDEWTADDGVHFPVRVVSRLAPQPVVDAVNHPAHYTSDPSGVECITITRHRNFNIGNAFKYLWRNGLKDDPAQDAKAKQIEDLKKAVFYINDEIARIEAL